MKTKACVILLAGLAFLSFTAFTTYSFIRDNKDNPLPVYGQVKDFTLINTQGKKFSLSHLQNKVWVADFIFTTCGSICPLMSKNMASLQRSYNLVDGVAFVSITVNPEQDSPAVFSEYAKEYRANQAKWHFLTGSREDITDLAVNSFKVGSTEEPIFHSASFILIDRNKQIRGYYDGTNQHEINVLFKDLARLINEQ